MKYFLFFLFLSVGLCAQENSQTVLYFPNDSADLLERHKVTIDSINRLYLGQKVSIRLEGYTNAYASDSYNLALSEKRVSAVAQGFDEGIAIEAVGFGELEGNSWKNRRVDVFVKVEKDVLQLEEKEGEIEKEVKVEQEIKLVPEQSGEAINDLAGLEVGDITTLEGILFLGGTDVILFESNATLIELYEFMKQRPHIRFKLIGHICCHGDVDPRKDGYNVVKKSYSLSADRAEAIYDYLVTSGIDARRIVHEGRAYLEPLGKGDKFDRRVEIEIMK